MRPFLTSSSLGALAFALSSPAAAGTDISTATTTPLATSSSGDIHVTSTGSIKPTSGTAVITINSNNKVTNEGTLAIQGVNGASGILANPGFTGDIANSGPITIDENYTPTDTDNDGDLDGPFALGNNRFGIHLASGGSYTGNVTNSGAILVEGNNSAGIALDSNLNGSFNGNNGKIAVTGDNSVGLRTGAVTGNVAVGNASVVSAIGANSIGVLVGGNVGGAVTIQGNVSATGYRNTTAPADPSKLDSDDLLQGGPAVLIAGNVGGGILLDAKPADSDPNNADEDSDGIPDASETTASVVSVGGAPGLKIGSATQDIAIGAVASSSNGHGLVIKGSVTGAGVYSGVNATGVEIGGTGHTVTIAGGMTVTGAVTANANTANATAIHIGSGATLPQILLSGTVNATGGGSATAAAQGILIDIGASVTSITNSGNMLITRTGTAGTATAIVDKSGTVGLVQNSGSISVVNAAALGNAATAIDLSANSTGAIVRQVAAASGKPAPTISGRILLGSGNDSLDIQAGSVTGNVDFGAGADTLSLSGNGLLRGTIANSGSLAVNVGTGSTLDVQNLGAINLTSLTTGSGASLGVRIGDSAHTLYNVSGTANIASGTKILVSFDHVGTAAGNYVILDAGTLVGGQNLVGSSINLPFLFDSTLTADTGTGQVTLGIERKTAAELGLNRSESAVIDAALVAADSDDAIASVFLGATDGQTLKNSLQQMLPEHAGGVFETVTKPSRLAADILAQPGMIHGLWLQQVAWGSSKSIGDTSSYNLSSWGLVGGYDRPVGSIGSVGVTLGYYYGKDHHSGSDLTSDHYEAGVYWRGGVGPLKAWARGTAAIIDFNNARTFTGLDDTATVSRTADGKWKGRLYSASGGVSYERHFGRFSIRPNASIEYYKLNEDGYTETGGGPGYDLTVRDRNSDEAAANAQLALGYEVMRSDDQDSGSLRIEIEGGRREILSGSVGDTVASFGSGNPFTLSADDRKSGWRGALRLLGGNSSLSFVVDATAEQQQGGTSIGGRAGINIGF